VVAPTADLPADRYNEIGGAIVRAAAGLSRELGYVEPAAPEAGAAPTTAQAA
jgi:hypothetical protein